MESSALLPVVRGKATVRDDSVLLRVARVMERNAGKAIVPETTALVVKPTAVPATANAVPKVIAPVMATAGLKGTVLVTANAALKMIVLAMKNAVLRATSPVTAQQIVSDDAAMVAEMKRLPSPCDFLRPRRITPAADGVTVH